MADSGPFVFTVTDLARLLGKASGTLRSWERKGIIFFPRDANNERKFETNAVRELAAITYESGRISQKRLHLIDAVVTLLEVIEQENK